MKKQKHGSYLVYDNPDDETVIRVRDLHKSFKLPTEKASGLKQAILNQLKGVRGYRKQSVLKGLDFEVKRGEFLGIVGRNGSGKSTLLKILSGIYTPQKGSVEVNGNLIPFIELGVGFNPDLTGRENVYMNGALLGFSNDEMDQMYDEIVSFAELEEFMDQKLKNYSSGMQVRLAFSIAIKAQGDILVLDEVLAVGDEAFQNKCNQFFEKIKRDKTKTVILVTHSMESVRQYCDRAILIRDGVIEIDGSPEDAANSYSLENARRWVGDANPAEDDTSEPEEIKDLKVELLSADQTTQDEKLRIHVTYTTESEMDTFVALTLWDIERNQSLINSNSKNKMCHGQGKHELDFEVSLADLNDVNIRVCISIRDKDGVILTYNPDNQSPTVTLRRDDYADMNNKTTDAVLFRRGEFKRTINDKK